MKKTLTTLLLLFLIASCGALKNTAKDPYVGSFDFTIFEVDNFGDIPIKMTLRQRRRGIYLSNGFLPVMVKLQEKLRLLALAFKMTF